MSILDSTAKAGNRGGRPPAPPPTQETIRQRSKVNAITGCWEWQGYRYPRGYGRHGDRYAHILSYELFKGPTLGLEVRHGCDNPCCVNPDHLCLGTHQQNMDDRQERGRTAKGERVARAKLNADQVREIRRLAADGTSRKELAKRFGVSSYPIYAILCGKGWQYV